MDLSLSYDYTEFLKELYEEIEDGILTKEDTIQILRNEKSLAGYHPIIDWYYNHEMMLKVLPQLPEATKEDYEKNRSALTEITVENCVREMYAVNKLVK